jgi:sporulation protein YlmC with PRC-barrel domain
MGTQVITRDSGRRLGVVGEVVVDIDRREVVALGLRDNPLTRFLPGLPRWMPLESIRQVGDVILVDSADSLSETFNPERYSKVINCQVITESGVALGRVLGFSFDIETGELSTLVIGALGVPLLGEGVLSTWELAVGEIVSSGTDRIIVYEGAEEKLKQLGTGLLEKLGIGGSSWEQEERERFRSGMIPAENQLPAGAPSALEQRRIQPASTRAVLPESELDYVELEERREREPLRQRLYLDEDERDQAPSRRRDAYGDEAYGRQEAAGWRDAEPGWRERGPELSPPRRRPERFGEERFEDERFEPERTGRERFEQADWRERERQDRYEDEPEPRDWRRDAAERPAGGRGPEGWERDDRSRFEREPRRDPRDEIRPASATEPAAQEPEAADWPPRSRQPLEAAPAQTRPPQAFAEADQPITPEGASWTERDSASRSPRGSSSRGGTAEPIDVEPEVLDDPW